MSGGFMSSRISNASLLLVLASGVGLVRSADAQHAPQMLRWEIRATVTDVVDPLGLFPGVRAGDPVRGMLKYDATLFPNPLYSDFYRHYFTNEPWMDVTRMVIENPRNGTEYAFQTDVEGGFADLSILNDYPFEEAASDIFYAPQSVVPPAGYQGSSPVVAVFLEGPTGIFPEPAEFPTIDDRPPTQLALDDWPIATIVFYDADVTDPTATSIEAEIYSLQAVADVPLAGDFDFDGRVDGRDLFGWATSFGGSLLYADANGDNEVDGADFLVWQRGWTATSGAGLSAIVPEPRSTGAVLLVACSVIAGATRARAS
jgi:hypothetical protein